VFRWTQRDKLGLAVNLTVYRLRGVVEGVCKTLTSVLSRLLHCCMTHAKSEGPV
jgi:hypothetical protein